MGVGRFLISTMTKMTHRGIVVQDCTKLLKPDSQETYQALCKGHWSSRCQGTAAWLSHHASLDRLVFLVSVSSFLREPLIQFQRRHLYLMEIGGAGNIDLEAVDSWKKGVNLDVGIDQ